MAPPSEHESGRTYEWEVPPAEVAPAPLPDWLAALMHGAPRKAKPSKPGEPIPEGKRNDTLASLAGTMRRRGADEEAILAGLRETNRKRCRPPLAEAEVAAIAESVCRYEPQAEAPRPTDLGNAELFCELHAERLRHVREQRRWLVWRGPLAADMTGAAEAGGEGNDARAGAPGGGS